MALGWHVSVYRQQNDGTAPATFRAPQGARLAVWQTGLYGLRWLDELVTQDKAIALGGNGYPLQYTAQASEIIPHVRGEIPEANAVWSADPGDILLPWWDGRTKRDPEAMAACRPDEWLIVEAWDES